MKHKLSIDHLPFASLAFDERVERALIPARVKALAREWNLEDVGAITISIRNRKPIVIDGQHRVKAAMELGLGETKVLCHVYRGLTLEEEARKFLSLNNSRAVTPFDRYKVGLVANDRTCIGVRDTLAKHNLRVAHHDGDGIVRCVGTCLALYERDPEILEQVCSVLTGAWGTRSAALEQMILSSLGQVLSRYNGELDRGVLVKKLSGYKGGPTGLAGDARGWADYRPITLTRAAGEIIVDTYNRGRRTGALEPL